MLTASSPLRIHNLSQCNPHPLVPYVHISRTEAVTVSSANRHGGHRISIPGDKLQQKTQLLTQESFLQNRLLAIWRADPSSLSLSIPAGKRTVVSVPHPGRPEGRTQVKRLGPISTSLLLLVSSPISTPRSCSQCPQCPCSQGQKGNRRRPRGR